MWYINNLILMKKPFYKNQIFIYMAFFVSIMTAFNLYIIYRHELLLVVLILLSVLAILAIWKLPKLFK
ncbi:hypothetical protein DUE52_07465 [Larkinella punicea]|uniref:Uncharacterized protein n=1 Tax=Larkinella punicea TaxID=2315727 RepID=A0A368JU40_9BACT|nr:hypothetical protein DUE52_07465 [Larkinella punicea]